MSTQDGSGQFEVEFRGFLTEEEFSSKLAWLRESAEDFEEDHRRSVFFILPEKTLKIAHLKSLNTARVTLKIGNISGGKQRELEMPISVESIGVALQIFTELGYEDKQDTEQLRYNGTIEDVKVSLKWSADWGHHFEAEIVVGTSGEISSAEERLRSFCARFELKALTESEFELFRKTIDLRHR